MSENADSGGTFDNVLRWLHEGYPQGVPPRDYFPLLALLRRSLTEQQVIAAAQSILRSTRSDTVTDDEIRTAVQDVIDTEPNTDEIRQVAARLASVGWPLATAR